MQNYFTVSKKKFSNVEWFSKKWRIIFQSFYCLDIKMLSFQDRKYIALVIRYVILKTVNDSNKLCPCYLFMRAQGMKRRDCAIGCRREHTRAARTSRWISNTPIFVPQLVKFFSPLKNFSCPSLAASFRFVASATLWIRFCRVINSFGAVKCCEFIFFSQFSLCARNKVERLNTMLLIILLWMQEKWRYFRLTIFCSDINIMKIRNSFLNWLMKQFSRNQVSRLYSIANMVRYK